MPVRTTALVVPLALAGCAPDLTVHASRVTAARVVAVRGEPAEARPNGMVTLTALVVTPQGDMGDSPGLQWTWCLVPRSASESTPVASACLGDLSGDAGSFHPAGSPMGLSVATAVPGDACMRVGPQVPPAGPDALRLRPPAADITGGWQVPLRVDLTVDGARETLVAPYRLRCSPPDVPGATAQGFALRYTANVNPVITALTDHTAALPRDLVPFRTGARGLDAAQMAMPPASVTVRDVPLTLQWPMGTAETYVRVDPATRGLVTATEALSVTWFTNGGTLDRDRTAPDSAGALASSNVLHIDPMRHDPVTVWVVLHDDRGGVDFTVTRLQPP